MLPTWRTSVRIRPVQSASDLSSRGVVAQRSSRRVGNAEDVGSNPTYPVTRATRFAPPQIGPALSVSRASNSQHDTEVTRSPSTCSRSCARRSAVGRRSSRPARRSGCDRSRPRPASGSSGASATTRPPTQRCSSRSSRCARPSVSRSTIWTRWSRGCASSTRPWRPRCVKTPSRSRACARPTTSATCFTSAGACSASR